MSELCLNCLNTKGGICPMHSEVFYAVTATASTSSGADETVEYVRRPFDGKFLKEPITTLETFLLLCLFAGFIQYLFLAIEGWLILNSLAF